jgi:nitroreductase
MDLFDVIARRRSVRQFMPDRAVGDDQLKRILEAATMAPSAGNAQCWKFIVVHNKKLKKTLATEAGHQLFIDQAPLILVVCADLEKAGEKYGARGRSTYALQETAAAIENMLLAAEALGLGACWIGSFDETKAAEILDLPKHLRPVAIVPVGTPAEPVRRVPPRRNLDDVVDYR